MYGNPVEVTNIGTTWGTGIHNRSATPDADWTNFRSVRRYDTQRSDLSLNLLTISRPL